MAIEIWDKILSKLRMRELGWKEAPISVHEGTPLGFDIEDSFITLKEDDEFRAIPPVNPDSEPE